MNPYYNPQFVRPALIPEGTTEDDGVYQLTDTSVNPTRVMGRTKLGMPEEESIPAVFWKPFVHPCGAVNRVPLRTGAVFSKAPVHEAYELREMRRLMISGWIPLWVCPYSYEYAAFTGGAFIPVPPGEKDCGGHVDPQARVGCVHLNEVMKTRTAAARARHDADERMLSSQTDEERKKLVADIIAGVSGGVGVALAGAVGGMADAVGASIATHSATIAAEPKLPSPTDLKAARKAAMEAEGKVPDAEPPKVGGK